MAPDTHRLLAASSHSSITKASRLSYTKQLDGTRAGFIIHHATVEVSDRRRLMSDQRSTGSRPWGEAGGRWEIWKGDMRSGGSGWCLLQNSTESRHLHASSRSREGIWCKRRSKKLIQIQNSQDYLLDIKKKKRVLWPNSSRDHLDTVYAPLRLQPGVRSVQTGELKQVWLHPK